MEKEDIKVYVKKWDTESNNITRLDHSIQRIWKQRINAIKRKEKLLFEFKMHVVELYLTTEVSYRELALSLGINNPPMIAKWVTDYRAVGPDALRPKRKGRKPKVSKPKKIIPNTGKEKAESEYLKQLEDENLRLRIENAYLKELRRLRLEEEKPPKNRQE